MIVSGTGRRAGVLAIMLTLVLAGCQVQAAPSPEGPRPSASADPPDQDPGTANEAPSGEPPESRSVTLAFAGDVHFEGVVGRVLYSPNATLGAMSSALRTADVAMVNLESALTTGGSPAAKEIEDPSRRYWFRSPPAALDLLERSGVDVVSMANNHGADYGAAGLQDTLRTAADSKVAVIGVGQDAAQAFRPYAATVNGVNVAVLAADASPAESRSPIWDVELGGPGLAAARNETRLLAAVRQANASSDVVAVYLHWGAEGQRCPTARQQYLAQRLADAGADVLVGSHAHRVQGAGMLGDTYVSYGLGNFLWYNGYTSDTGVLRVQIRDGKVVRDDWVPATIRPAGGRPVPLAGSARRDAIQSWRDLRGCTNLEPGPTAGASSGGGIKADPVPAYVAKVESLPEAVRRRMTGSSHDAARCPVGLADLRLLTLSYVGFDGRTHSGQLVVNQRHADDLVGVFRELYEARFPIRRMALVDAYGGDDNRSMAADNSSAYNCRTVAGETTFSAHAYGDAVDLNPVENPYLTAEGVLPPAGERFARVDRSKGAKAGPGVIVADDVVVRAFTRIGWKWGGVWNEADYQHFHAP